MPHIEHQLGWPSVTQILDPYDKRWLKFFYKKHGSVEAAERYAAIRADVGSKFHLALEVLLNGEDIELALNQVPDADRDAVTVLANSIESLGLEKVGSEREVESKKYAYHGSLDGLVKIQNTSFLPNEDYWGTPLIVDSGVLAIVDLKTKENDKRLNDGEMKKHAMQMTAYGNAVAEEDGTYPPLGVIIQLDIPTRTVTLECAYPLERWFKAFLLQRQNWDLINNKGEWVVNKKRKK